MYIVDTAEGTYNPSSEDENREDYQACLKMKQEYKDNGYEVSDKCYAGTNTLVTNHYCFNYNAGQVQDNYMAMWKAAYPKPEFTRGCKKLNGVVDSW